MGNHGGKRPGSGAPRGNINALKTGTNSKQIRELLEQTGEGFFILDKKRKRLVWVYTAKDLEKLKEGGLEV